MSDDQVMNADNVQLEEGTCEIIKNRLHQRRGLSDT